MAVIGALDTPQYTVGTLSESDLGKDPVAQFRKWFDEAQEAKVPMPEMINLATAELPSGRVSSRQVLMKELDDDGRVIIYTNLETSRKANDIATNKNVAATFWWIDLQKQVRVEGTVSKVSREKTQAYFDTRPRNSRLGAWASAQSKPVADREQLEQELEHAEKRFEGSEQIPAPPYWGGYAIEPTHWEFWQGRSGRVHDRFYYDKVDGEWVRTRVAP